MRALCECQGPWVGPGNARQSVSACKGVEDMCLRTGMCQQPWCMGC